jgi:hypothetical protein
VAARRHGGPAEGHRRGSDARSAVQPARRSPVPTTSSLAAAPAVHAGPRAASTRLRRT